MSQSLSVTFEKLRNSLMNFKSLLGSVDHNGFASINTARALAELKENLNNYIEAFEISGIPPLTSNTSEIISQINSATEFFEKLNSVEFRERPNYKDQVRMFIESVSRTMLIHL